MLNAHNISSVHFKGWISKSTWYLRIISFYPDSDGNTLSSDQKQTFPFLFLFIFLKIYMDQMDWLYLLADWLNPHADKAVFCRIKPACRRIKPVNLVPIFHLNYPNI